MTIIRKVIYENEPLTPEKIEEIERASKMPITFDEDCPELDAEQLQKLTAIAKQQRAERKESFMTIKVHPVTLKKAKLFGKSYTDIMGRLLDMTINNSEILKQCIEEQEYDVTLEGEIVEEPYGDKNNILSFGMKPINSDENIHIFVTTVCKELYLKQKSFASFKLGNRLKVKGVWDFWKQSLQIKVTNPENIEVVIKHDRKVKLCDKLKKIYYITTENSLVNDDFTYTLGVENKPYVLEKIIVDGISLKQGKYTEEDILGFLMNALDECVKDCSEIEAQEDSFDTVICIIRGGGDEESFNIFNDLSLCEKINSTKFPVLVAVGHACNITLANEYMAMPEDATYIDFLTPTSLANYLKRHL